MMGGLCRLLEPIQPSILFSVYYRFHLHVSEFQETLRTEEKFKEFSKKKRESLVVFPLYDASSPPHEDHDDLPSGLLPLLWLCRSLRIKKDLSGGSLVVRT